MRKATRWLLSLAVLIGTAGAGSVPAGAATAAGPETEDIKDRILAIPGMSLVEEKPVDGYRYFVLNYSQPVDHRHPSKGTFQQRLTLLHKSVDRPTVFFTSGYNVSTTPSRSEPTKIIDGNQVSMEYRYFTPSRPTPTDWKKLDIRQAANDQHRIFRALHRIYGKNWIDTGGSKGGMTATYYRRFFPDDMNGTVAYVAPNDVRNDADAAYDRFFRTVGTKECRTALTAIEREALLRRGEMVKRFQDWADKEKQTFTKVGNADRAYEVMVTDLVFGFWQYQPAETACAEVPEPTVSTDELWKWMDKVGGFDSYTDQGMEPYTPYYYQAGTQLGEPGYRYPQLAGLLKYPGINNSRSFVPKDIPMRFDKRAMPDIDRWVRHRAHRMMFVNGQYDPWSSEHFEVGKNGARDSYVFTVPGGNHGSNIAKLKEADRTRATAELLDWAGVQAPEGKPAPLAPDDKKLDKQEFRRMPLLRP
ncbi:aminopeptidase [Streptomyces sp. Je 1-4]|uniref:S28 family serine protease n=1 Tax=Streptomyces TaxID=1883 RepID=UPI00140E96F2|nr:MULTISPECIES: S28 family serine protease [unclassified Streptomyces]QIK08672.1 aminopeptidase [Streptomyces sp. ID38640]UYB42332.1 aminopeptidase [Streptomyces sp. Je 1-4]UZQ38631.1 aminopeptidase [Streptomyces sp. Je 1-4] [Streptomyces sp. Je 1-4 4N24]UZQ46048.1 aminopeptidase [Streptomyces sp. Je 1-4] [Streptomyces sp. Je 1-4 4N24_ara]